MATLTQVTKLFIVGRLACFDSPSEVVKAVKEELGVTATRSQVQAYDPTTAQGARLSKELASIFTTTRKKFLKDTTSIPIANKAVRLRLLQRMTDKAMEKNNSGLASSLLEQAAKESGEAFTNRHHVNLKGSLDVKPGMPSQQLVDRLAKFGIRATLPGTTAPAPGQSEGGQ